MTTAKIILAGTAVLAIVSSAALAQDAQKGTITKIDRIHGTVAIQREDKEGTTVGSSTGGSSGDEFKIQGGLSLEDVHAGDKVTYSTTEAGSGPGTLTKIQKQKD